MQTEDIMRLKSQGFDYLLKIEEVVERTSLSLSTIKRLIKIGDFPEGMTVSNIAVRWRSSDIEKWIKNLGESNGKQK